MPFVHKKRRTLWDHVVNAGVAVADKRNIDEGTAHCLSTTRLLQSYLEEDGALVLVAKRLVLLDVWIGRIEAALNLQGAHNGRL